MTASAGDAPVAAVATPGPRLPWIDAARGAAVAAMIVYHFSWDLRHFAFIGVDVAEEPGWRIFARLIAGTFLALVGVGLVLATRHGFDRLRFLGRVAIIAAGALAITIATRIVTPDEYIFFGVLHCIAVSSLLALPFLGAPILLVAAAAAFCFAAPALLSGPLFDAPALLWLGLSTTAPRSNDFVPILPWFGVLLAGLAVARLVRRYAPAALAALERSGSPAALVWAGRRSLPIYLLHQPVLFGLVYLATQVFPPDYRNFTASYVRSWTASCVASGATVEACRRTSQCIADRTQAEGLWPGLVGNTLSQEQVARTYDLADECRADPAAGEGVTE